MLDTKTVVFKVLLVLFFVPNNLLILPICPFEGFLYTGHSESATLECYEAVEIGWDQQTKAWVPIRLCHFACDWGVITALYSSFLSPEIWGRYIFISKILSRSIGSIRCFFREIQRLQDYIEPNCHLPPNFALVSDGLCSLPDIRNSLEIMSKGHQSVMVTELIRNKPQAT